MSIDWNRIGESALLIVPTAAVSGYIGARIKAHLDRAKPHITITTCRKGEASDLIGSKVHVPDALGQKFRTSPWCEILVGDVNAVLIFRQHERLVRMSTEARNAISFIDAKIALLSTMTSASVDAKLAFLDELTRSEVAIIDASFTGALCRREYALPEVSDAELQKNEKIADFVESKDDDKPGFKINLRTKFYRLGHRSKLNDLLLPVAKAMCWFHIPSLQMLLSNVKKDLASLAVDSAGLITEMEQVLAAATPLIVEVTIVNRGRSTATFSSWGACRITADRAIPPIDIPLKRASAYWKPEDPVLAAQQQKVLIESDDIDFDESRFFTLDGGKGGEMRYRSVDSLAELERKCPQLSRLLQLDMFRCQVMLKRADVDGQHTAWVVSRTGVFGTCNDAFPQGDLSLIQSRWEK